MLINGIVAYDLNKGIGLNNTLPWKLSGDINRFKKITIGNGNNAIIMGKNTWESVSFLKQRDNLILSSSLNIHENNNNNLCKSFSNLEDILLFCEKKHYDTIWVIGGHQIYKLFFDKELIDNLYVTFINQIYKCDIIFPTISEKFFLIYNQVLPEVTEKGNNTYLLLYKFAKPGLKVNYNSNEYIIHSINCFSDNNKCVFILQDDEYKLIKTDKNSLKLIQ